MFDPAPPYAVTLNKFDKFEPGTNDSTFSARGGGGCRAAVA
jgi:hypothetical protein